MHGLVELFAIDAQAAFGALLGDFLDRGQDQHGRIIGMAMERCNRRFTVFCLMFFEEVLIFVCEYGEIRAGMIHAYSGFARGL